MVFGRWSKRAADDVEAHDLHAAVREALPQADAPTHSIVTAIAGLLGGVAYADREYSPQEEDRVRSALGRVHGLVGVAVEAILSVLREHIVEVATVQSPRYCRSLVEEGDRDLRLEVLDILVDLAAADGQISHEETTLLRNTTRALGLEQDDYNAIQAKHRDKLSVLGRE
jgi:uncharacterized tellurite resistance protein B-like protein